MAVFEMTVVEQPEILYTSGDLAFSKEDCSALNENIELGFTEIGAINDIEYLLSTYTGIGALNLKIKDIVYSNDLGMYLDVSGTKLTAGSGTPVTISVSGLTAGDPVVGFTVKLFNLNLVQNETITFNLAIEDTNNVIGEYISVTIFLEYLTCLVVADTFIIRVDSTVVDGCESVTVLTVQVPPGGSRYVDISSDTPDTTDVTETITVDKQYTLLIKGIIGTNTEDENVVITVKDAIGGVNLGGYNLKRFHTGIDC